MKIRWNGEWREVPETHSVSTLLNELGCDENAYVLAVNGEHVPRSEYTRKHLKDLDELEILTPQSGG